MGRLLLLLIILPTAQRESIQLRSRPSEEERAAVRYLPGFLVHYSRAMVMCVLLAKQNTRSLMSGPQVG